MDLKPGVLIALITRGDESILPRGSDQMQAGDSVVVITNNCGFTDISDILNTTPYPRQNQSTSSAKGRKVKP